RIALLADIHGNLLGLDAVLEELERERVDRIICLGGVAVGPQPMETLERLKGVDRPVLMGNWDAWFLDGFPKPPDELARKLVEIGVWWADQLEPEGRRYMRTFEQLLETDLGAETTLAAFHGSPRSFDEGIYATTPDAEVEQMLDGVEASLLVCGHAHSPLLRRFGESLIVNPGSVGLAFRRDGPVMRIATWAEYGLLTVDADRLAVEFRRTLFDVAALAKIMLASGMPHAEWWTGLWTTGHAARSEPAS
ncbi:MAG: metallophosphoesterase family protein, partial [Actinomycetota bacterium]